MVISLASPLIVGLYKNGLKIGFINSDQHTSEALISVLEELSQNYNITKIIYASTPGSFMGLKVAYVILKTFCLVKGCDFCAVSGFELNGGAIRANKQLSFVQKDGEISLEKCDPMPFVLPENLDTLNLSNETLPNYVLQAV